MAKYDTKRLFRSISDSQMLMKAEGFQRMFVWRITEFEALYPDLNLDVANELQAFIVTARGVDADYALAGELMTLKQYLNKKWKACRDVFNDLRYYIERAFPDNIIKWNEFGYGSYREMSRSHLRVNLFMNLLHKAFEDNKTELMAVGVQQAQIDNILVVKNDFWEAQQAQQSFLKTRPVLTQTKVTKLNNVWTTLKRINKASKRVFRKNYEGLQMFLLPAAASNEQSSLSVTGVVFDLQTSEPIANAKVEIPKLQLQTTTDENGRFGFAKRLPHKEEATLRVSAPGFGVKEQPIKTYKAKKQFFEIGLNVSA